MEAQTTHLPGERSLGAGGQTSSRSLSHLDAPAVLPTLYIPTHTALHTPVPPLPAGPGSSYLARMETSMPDGQHRYLHRIFKSFSFPG